MKGTTLDSGNKPSDIEIDVDALNEKYAEERAKRFRDDAIHQYQELSGKFAEFDTDPWVDSKLTRDPIVGDTDALMIGGGFAGMLAGCRLREYGVEDFRIVEKGGDFGGTWYWNRYPGVQCDVESYVYMPMLEEMGYVPTEKYSHGTEIFAYAKRLAERYDLYRGALFQTGVKDLHWDDDRNRWIVSTDRGDRIAARFVVSCTGLLSKPKLPGIPGIESFEGHSFHTSRWDFAYTGGDQTGGMTGLSDKVVGIIGTGSTGIQAVPLLAESAKHLYIFQRTPSSVDERNNRPTDPEWAKSLTPGWHHERRNNFTDITSGNVAAEDLINDSWTDIIRNMAPPAGGDIGNVDPKELALAEMKKMEQCRQRVSRIVRDETVAEALKPYYHYFCKRPGFNDEYLDCFNRDNVTLVDTQGKGVERITPRGLVVAGREYPLDCLIYATGFDFLMEYTREAGVEVTGPGGLSLGEYWSHGPRTLYGIQTRNFPNFFLMSLSQAGVAINYLHIADEQTRTIAYTIAECLKRGIATIEPTEEAQEAWVDTIVAGSGPRRQFFDTCIPSYYNYEGKKQTFAELSEFYAPGPMPYIALLDKFRDDGNLPGLEVDRRKRG